MKALLHKILYRTLPLEGYLRAVSRLFFISYRLGLGRRSAATEYVYHLPRLAKAGDTAIDIGANLGAVTFTARMRRGSELFAGLERLDFVKCDVEGYELIVMRELRPLLERFRPTVLIETGGENRPQIIELFTEKDIIFRQAR